MNQIQHHDVENKINMSIDRKNAFSLILAD